MLHPFNMLMAAENAIMKTPLRPTPLRVFGKTATALSDLPIPLFKEK
jgi:hypothetical protein